MTNYMELHLIPQGKQVDETTLNLKMLCQNTDDDMQTGSQLWHGWFSRKSGRFYTPET